MRRREFVAMIGSALAAPLVRAQKPSALPIVGMLTPHPRGWAPSTPDVYRKRLAELGWVDGQSYIYERPDAQGREDMLPALAEELVRKRVTVIYALGPEAAVAAARATRTIPIVFWGVSAPIEQGLIESYARPGRNITGSAWAAGDERLKMLEFLAELAPKAKRLASIAIPSAVVSVAGEPVVVGRSATLAAASKLGLTIESVPVARIEDFEGAFAAIEKMRAQGLIVPGTTLTLRERKRFVEFADRARIPIVSNMRAIVESGALLSYGIDLLASVMDALKLVDRILRGAKPADLPVELPSKFEFVLNLKTARALGLKVPQTVLLRADRVIE